MQGKSGSAQQIQKLQQAVQAIEAKIQRQQQLAEEMKNSTQPVDIQTTNNKNASSRKAFTSGIDVEV